MSDEPRRKLIEVALPLEAINRESAREKSIRHGHPSTLHLWWARRPLAACRAVLFASLVDDPSSRPDLYSDEEADAERERLFRLMERLVTWEATTDERLLEEVRAEILRSTDGSPPPVLDPFCGGGSIPLEAQRLGLECHASDLNPVAVLITKALVEIPPRFRGAPPVNPDARNRLDAGLWIGAKGLADDVRFYGAWMRQEAERRIGALYPKAQLPDGSEATVIAWIWTRTVKCPNPACGGEMPLVSTFALATKKGRKAWIEPIVDRGSRKVDFRVVAGRDGQPPDGPKLGRGAKFRCLVCGESAPEAHIKAEGVAGRMGMRLMATVAEGDRKRIYLPPDPRHADVAATAEPVWQPDQELAPDPRNIWCIPYGLIRVSDLFTRRQLAALSTFTDLVGEAHERVLADATAGGDRVGDPASYADAVATFLAFGVSRLANRGSSTCIWNTGGEKIEQTFKQQAIPMAWDFAEANPLSDSTGSWSGSLEWIPKVLERAPALEKASVRQLDATQAVNGASSPMVCTDPPYYDNIGYADLFDFFYVWLRRTLKSVYPDLFSTLLTPKAQELVAVPYRFDGNKKAAQQHFETGLRNAFALVHEIHSAAYPLTLFYAFKQAESDKDGLASTGWETMLEGLLGAGFMVTGTWPMRTERDQGLKTGTSVLASSIVLVCRPRLDTAALATRKEFTAALRGELPDALRRLQSGSIAPVDLAQAAIGPGMAIFSRYSKVVEADGKPMRVRAALSLINEALDELLAEQEADFDADTRWCVAWFDQHGMNEGPFGIAETLSRAKNTAINGLVNAGVLQSRGGKVRLLDREELAETWDPTTDLRLTVWEVTQHLIARHQNGGEVAAAELLRQLGGGLAEAAQELAYRLYAICERKGWAQEALAYNALVSAWPEITRLAAQAPDAGGPGQQETMEV